MKRKPKNSKNQTSHDVLTLKEACELLNCHPNTLRNWDNKGVLRAIRFGSRGDRRYRKQDILKLIKK